MSPGRSSGGAAIEFALLLPVLFSLTFALSTLGALAIVQFRLERLCTEVARALALSSLETTGELTDLARSLLAIHGRSITVDVKRREVPAKPQAILRDNRSLDVIELTISQSVPIPQFMARGGPDGLALSATVWESRMRP